MTELGRPGQVLGVLIVVAVVLAGVLVDDSAAWVDEVRDADETSIEGAHLAVAERVTPTRVDRYSVALGSASVSPEVKIGSPTAWAWAWAWGPSSARGTAGIPEATASK